MFVSPAVRIGEEQRGLPIGFASLKDAENLEQWDVVAGHPNPTAAYDAVEFARLGGKRWRYYAHLNDIAKSLVDLASKVKTEPKREVGFLLVAKLDWKSSVDGLAMAWCRRTWCNHLVLDFLACHPSVLEPKNGYGGIGSAMLVALALISKELKSPLLWGEATELSAGFYSRTALGGKKVLDHFFIQGTHLKRLQKEGIKYAVQSH